MKTVVCVQCGKTFESYRGSTMYCSAACRQSAYRQRKPQKPSTDDPYLLICAICNVEFLAQRADAQFCSPTCRTTAHRRRNGHPDAPSLDPALWREGDQADRVQAVKESGKFWDRRSWSKKW